MRKWTEDETKILKENYPVEGSKVSIRFADRSPVTCDARARILGIKRRDKN